MYRGLRYFLRGSRPPHSRSPEGQRRGTGKTRDRRSASGLWPVWKPVFEAREAADAARFAGMETRLEEQAAQLKDMPSTSQIVAAMEQLLVKDDVFPG